jgi:Iron-containing redox enzyme
VLTPKARGALSAALFSMLPTLDDDELGALPPAADDAADEQVALWALYELHYRGFEDVPAELEWHPGLLRLRGGLERLLERRLRARFASAATEPDIAGNPDLAASMFAFIDAHDGRSLASHVHRAADREQVLELLRMRSIYHLKEMDPTTWVVPRLPRASQAALVEVMYDEYGTGRPRQVHSELFSRAMVACGLDDRYGVYIDEVPAEVLEQNNTMTLFGLHRRLRGAAVGHFAAFEATSSLPSRRISQGLERLEMPAEVRAYYTEHVEADAVHEQLAVRSVCAPLVEEDPAMRHEVFLGAFSCLDLEDRTARAVLASWSVAA